MHFPKEVAGLVFSNRCNRIGRPVNGKPGLIWELTEEQIRSMFPLAASEKGGAPISEDDPFRPTSAGFAVRPAVA